MPRPRQRRLEIAQRRLRVARLYLQRMRMVDIGAEVGVSEGTVSKDIKALKQEWLKESREAVGLVLARELAEVDQMEREAAALFALSARWRIGADGTPENLPNHSRAQGWAEKRLKMKELRAKLLGLFPGDRAITPAGAADDAVFRATVTAEGVIVCSKVEQDAPPPPAEDAP